MPQDFPNAVRISSRRSNMSCRKWEIQILRWHEGALDEKAEAPLLQHLGSCVRCRTLAGKFSALDSLFVSCQEPSLPPFLREKIISSVTEVMRQDSVRGVFSHHFRFLASFRPAIAGIVLMLGIGLGVVAGWNLAQSVSRIAAVSSYDLLSVAGFGGVESGSSLEFIWTDSDGRTGR